MSKIAVIRIRGKCGVRKDISDTMKMMKLYNKYHCVVVENSKSFVGMIKKIKDYATWGEIDSKTMMELLKKRGRLPRNQRLTEEYIQKNIKQNFEQFAEEVLTAKKSFKDVEGLKSFFRLKPPEGGFERKGIKKPFSIGGSLGYRKEKINELIRRML